MQNISFQQILKLEPALKAAKIIRELEEACLEPIQKYCVPCNNGLPTKFDGLNPMSSIPEELYQEFEKALRKAVEHLERQLPQAIK